MRRQARKLPTPGARAYEWLNLTGLSARAPPELKVSLRKPEIDKALARATLVTLGASAPLHPGDALGCLRRA